jgi:hypothetical protein
MRAEHNAAFPNSFINPISYGKYVEAMGDKGYSRMRCYTGVCECHSNGHVNWKSLLTLFSEVRASFLELEAPKTLLPELLELASPVASVTCVYYKFEFKTHVNHDTTEASHNTQLACRTPVSRVRSMSASVIRTGCNSARIAKTGTSSSPMSRPPCSRCSRLSSRRRKMHAAARNRQRCRPGYRWRLRWYPCRRLGHRLLRRRL